MGGGSDLEEASNRLGLPQELVSASEGFRHSKGEIFPDNAQTVLVFSDMITQWRVGPNGIVGLDYNVLPFAFRIRNIKAKKRESIFEGLKIMERAAIKEIRGN